MTKVEQIEREVRELSPQDLASFREWFVAFDAADWDRQFPVDATSGTLDRMADEALADHRAGRSRRL